MTSPEQWGQSALPIGKVQPVEKEHNILALAARLGASPTWTVVVVAASLALAAPPGGSAQAQPAALAWIRFDKAREQYAGKGYLWLGRFELRLTIDAAPQPGRRLELLWGAKGDTRGAVATINGHQITIRHGGYDGFRWLPVAMPKGLGGKTYDVVLRAAPPKAGFLAAVRLVAAAGASPAAPDPKDTPAHRITLKTVAVGPAPQPAGEAFPEMRKIWDRQPPAPPAAGADAKAEAAFRLAEKNARLANEMLFRCRKFVDGWLACADPNTGLIPRNLSRNRDIWNAKDAAADNYPFMVLTCALTDRPRFDGRMLQMLRTETKLTSRVDRLPDTWSFRTQAFADAQPNLDRLIFGGSEYVKDGLLPLTEWLGESPWSQRMVGILDDIWKHAKIDTPAGAIPSTNVEVNGEMLQALSRVYWMTGQRKYLDWAVRLGDYYLLGEHHPTRDFRSLRLRDHGCEIVSGLSELYAAVHFAAPEKKKAYHQPIHAVFDRILEVARDERGMLYNSINPKAGTHGRGICDTWGYNYNGVYTVYLIDGTRAYRDAVRHVLGNLPKLTDHHWGSADEYADSIEGAINLYNRERVEAAATWIDSEIHDMWRRQRPDGVIEGWHGDGNSARTAIMYALWKTAGLTVQPWRADVRFGTVRRGGTLYVSLTADKAWAGRLVFDRARHKLQMKLPLDYPRINQFPEWFTAEAARRYVVRDAATGKAQTRTGEQLARGMKVSLKPAAEVRFVVEAQEE